MASRAPPPGRSRSGNAAVAAAARAALAADPRIGLERHPLALAFGGGVLTIEGEVGSPAAKKLGLERAAAARGRPGARGRARRREARSEEEAMLVKEAMTRRAATIGPGETVQAAARRMRELGIGALPVCEGDRLVGFLTDRDIVVRSTAEGKDPARDEVGRAMTAQVIWCSEGDDVETAAGIMERRAVRRVVVLDPQRRLVGMLSADDLALVSGALATDVIEHSVAPERARGTARPPAGR